MQVLGELLHRLREVLERFGEVFGRLGALLGRMGGAYARLTLPAGLRGYVCCAAGTSTRGCTPFALVVDLVFL